MLLCLLSTQREADFPSVPGKLSLEASNPARKRKTRLFKNSVKSVVKLKQSDSQRQPDGSFSLRLSPPGSKGHVTT